MHRQPLLTLLEVYTPLDADEHAMWQQTLDFVKQQPDCFERSLLAGHITGSAWIINRSEQTLTGNPLEEIRTVLIHHRKLDRWLQPGGHADGDPDVAAVALREAREETGLTTLRLVSPAIYDIDVHTIPARGNVPEHLHYDIRFLLEADPSEPFGQSDETNDTKWFDFAELDKTIKEKSILRLKNKSFLHN